MVVQQRRSETATDTTIAYIGGGSREWAPKFVQDMSLSALNGTVRLYDRNYESAQQNAKFGNWVQEKDAATADWSYEAVADIASALNGADAVILSTQFDPAETFVHDLDISEKYGIYGAVSATIGPGGIFRAMRTIPVYRELANAIREHCPEAWVFNFTNPVHFVTRALYDEYPEINAVGLCHEVLKAYPLFASIAEEHLDMDADPEDITINPKGINHFTWIDKVHCNGEDIWPQLQNLIDSERAQREYTAEDLEEVSPFIDNEQVMWELFRRFDLIPAGGDRHLVEYATWFLNGQKEGLNRWGVKRTDSNYRAKHWNPSESDQTTDVEAWMSGTKEFEIESSREKFADMLEALHGREPCVANVNMPNTGQVSNIENGAIVETNAYVRANEVVPLTAGGLPRPLKTVVDDHVNTIETIIEASRDGDIDRAFQGFLIDPQLRSLQTEDARDLYAELFRSLEEYLSAWNVQNSEILEESPKW
jgi:alpha-galactosidase